MIIENSRPYSKDQLRKLRQEFDVYIKTVIDIQKKICSAGANRHFESEERLIKSGSSQSDLWGGGLDLETKTINVDSMINIRPSDGNRSNEIQDPQKRQIFEDLTKHFFKVVFDGS
jgi:hypothetical protein